VSRASCLNLGAQTAHSARPFATSAQCRVQEPRAGGLLRLRAAAGRCGRGLDGPPLGRVGCGAGCELFRLFLSFSFLIYCCVLKTFVLWPSVGCGLCGYGVWRCFVLWL
jgi:hypothetical protein